MKTQEAGQALNLANFQDLLKYCTDHGPRYNPPANANIGLPVMQTALNDARLLMKVVYDAEELLNKRVEIRQFLFDELDALTQRIISALVTGKASAKTLARARALRRKFTGARKPDGKPAAKKKNSPQLSTDGGNTNPEGAGKGKRKVSVSQLSFENKVKHFVKLIALLAAEVNYQPNEPDLQLVTLQGRLSQMEMLNIDVPQLEKDLDTVRRTRNRALNHPETGIIAKARLMKAHVLEVFGPGSTEHKQVTAIQFKVYLLKNEKY